MVTSRMSVPSMVTRPSVDVVETGDEVHQSRLPAAAHADEGNHLARPDVQVDVFQDRCLVVTEGDLIDGDSLWIRGSSAAPGLF